MEKLYTNSGKNIHIDSGRNSRKKVILKNNRNTGKENRDNEKKQWKNTQWKRKLKQ